MGYLTLLDEKGEKTTLSGALIYWRACVYVRACERARAYRLGVRMRLCVRALYVRVHVCVLVCVRATRASGRPTKRTIAIIFVGVKNFHYDTTPALHDDFFMPLTNKR